MNCATAALQVQSSAARGSGAPWAAVSAFSFSTQTLLCSFLQHPHPSQSGRTLGNNKLHRALSIQENKARNMMQYSVRMLPLDCNEGETKGHTTPVFSEKETPKHFLEEFTAFLWLRDSLIPKNILWAEMLQWQSVVCHSRLPPQLSCFYVFQTAKSHLLSVLSALCLFCYQLTKKNRLLTGHHNVHVIKLLV